jgi:hypothetical protein
VSLSRAGQKYAAGRRLTNKVSTRNIDTIPALIEFGRSSNDRVVVQVGRLAGRTSYRTRGCLGSARAAAPGQQIICCEAALIKLRLVKALRRSRTTIFFESYRDMADARGFSWQFFELLSFSIRAKRFSCRSRADGRKSGTSHRANASAPPTRFSRSRASKNSPRFLQPGRGLEAARPRAIVRAPSTRSGEERTPRMRPADTCQRTRVVKKLERRTCRDEDLAGSFTVDFSHAQRDGICRLCAAPNFDEPPASSRCSHQDAKGLSGSAAKCVEASLRIFCNLEMTALV